MAFLASAVLYVATSARAVTGEDAGEFLAAAHVPGVPHPPGYPLWLLLSWLADHALPFETTVFQVTLVSSLPSAAAVALLVALLFKHCVGRVTACGAAALFVVSLTHWTQAVIPEVYGLNTVFIALQLLLLVRLAAAPSGRRLLLLAGVTGLSATNHTTEIPVATIVAVLERTAQACDGYPLVHATDNGPPYVSHEVAELHARERVIPLRNRLHTPTDNARAERGSGELHGTGSTTSCRAPRSVGGQRRRLTACCRGGTLWWTGRSSMPLRAPPSLPPCSAAARRVHDARRNARRSPRPWSDSNSSEEPEAVRLSTLRNAKVFREQHGFGWQ